MRPRHRSLRMAAAVVVASLGLLVAFAPSASAATSTTASPVQTGVVCSTASSSSSTVADNYLPLNRWSGALGAEHTRLPGGLFSGITNAPNTIDRTAIVGGLSSVSSAEWSLGTSAVTAASNFCFAHSVGTTIDSLAAGLGNALLSSPIVAILVAVGLFIILWRTMRGRERPLRSAAKVLAIAGVLVAVTASATSSAATGTSTIMSPSWILDTTFNAISNVASAPAAALSNITINGSSVQAKIAKNDPLSCYWYNSELTHLYQSSYQAAGSNAYVVPEALDAMWEQSALPAYVSEQFGSQNNYGPLAYCHLLEDQSGVSPQTQMNIALASGALSGDPNLASFGATQPSALVWNGAVSNNQEDESLVAWAACQSPNTSGFKPSEWNAVTGTRVSSAWTTTPNTAAPTGANQPNQVVTGADCGVFWKANAPATGGQCGDASCSPFNNASAAPWTGSILNPDYGVVNWGSDSGAIASATNANPANGSEINNFLSNFHGTSNSAAASTAFVFLLASSAILVVFLILALAVIIAKLSLVLWMVLLPVMLALSLLPSFAGRLGKFIRHMVGLAIFATSMGLILSFVAIVTNLLSSVSTAAFGAGTIFSLIFLAVSPVAAVWLLHTFFKKVLKAPSPFSPTGAAAWGSSMGGFGAGAAGGVLGADAFTHLSRLKDRGMHEARSRVRSGVRGRQGPERYRGAGSMGEYGPASDTPTTGRSSSSTTSTPEQPTVSTPSEGSAHVSPEASAPISTTNETVDSPSTAEPSVTPDVGPSAPSPTSGVTPSTPSEARTPRRRSGEMGEGPGVRPWETEQAQANRHARARRLEDAAVNARRAVRLVTQPGESAKAAFGKASDTGKALVNRVRAHDGETSHWVRGSLKTAGSAVRGTARAVRQVAPRLPTYTKRAVIGVGAVAAVGFGAPALAVFASSAGLLALRDRHRAAPVRAAKNLSTYRQFQSDQAAAELQRAADDAAEKKRLVDAQRTAEIEEEARQAEERAEAERRAQESEAERAANEKDRREKEARRRQERMDSQRRQREWHELAGERRRVLREIAEERERELNSRERAWRSGNPGASTTLS